MAHIILNWANI